MLYGGAAGGGKTDALLMGALMYVDQPGYSAIIFRRTYPELDMSVIPRSHEWLAGTDATYSEKRSQWTFPSGAVLKFGHLQYENDKYAYNSAEFQYAGFDELTQFSETQFRFITGSRMRRLLGSDIPIRIRAASNPGGIGHDWVRTRFIDSVEPGRRFLPARLADNPWLDEEEYRKSLAELDPVSRRQLLDGDWSARQPGGKFKREWLRIVDRAPEGQKVRYWDLAATEARPGKDPDWTAGCLMTKTSDGQYVIEDMRHVRERPAAVERLIAHTHELDGPEVAVWMEQEPGASGVAAVDHYRRRVLPSADFHADKVTGNKELRANPLSSQAEAGNVSLVRGEWNGAFLDEAEAFPMGSHDDMVDAAAGAFTKLHGSSSGFFFA